MRRLVVTAAVSACLLALPATATPGGSGVKGEVRNTTCPGPCFISYDPPLYTGSGLTVKIRRLASGDVIATLHPKDGRFTINLPPGRYGVRADVDGWCWNGSAKNVQVGADGYTRTRLNVHNDCVL